MYSCTTVHFPPPQHRTAYVHTRMRVSHRQSSCGCTPVTTARFAPPTQHSPANHKHSPTNSPTNTLTNTQHHQHNLPSTTIAPPPGGNHTDALTHALAGPRSHTLAPGTDGTAGPAHKSKNRSTSPQTMPRGRTSASAVRPAPRPAPASPSTSVALPGLARRRGEGPLALALALGREGGRRPQWAHSFRQYITFAGLVRHKRGVLNTQVPNCSSLVHPATVLVRELTHSPRYRISVCLFFRTVCYFVSRTSPYFSVPFGFSNQIDRDTREYYVIGT